MKKDYDDSWFHTWAGQRFYYSRPEEYDFCIEEISAVLGNIQRYGGHLRDVTYSVRDHSLNVFRCSQAADPGRLDIHMMALLHDASEAYLGDIVTPLKRRLPVYADLERKVQSAIISQLLPECPVGYSDGGVVKAADLAVLGMERVEFIPSAKSDWFLPDIELALSRPTPEWFDRGSADSGTAFIDIFHALYGVRGDRR